MENDLLTTLDNIQTDKNTNLLPENLKAGITCLGVEGTIQPGLDTSDATATANDILYGKTAYGPDGKMTGTIMNNASYSPMFVDTNVNVSTKQVQKSLEDPTMTDVLEFSNQNLNKSGQKCLYTSIELNAEFADVANAVGLTPEKLVQGNTILGVEGTATTGGVDTSDATASANDIVSGKTAYVNGEKITGMIVEYKPDTELGEQYFIASKFDKTGNGSGLLISGYNSDDGLFRAGTYLGVNIGTEEQSQLANLIGLTADKIKAGETILGVTGTYTGGNQGEVVIDPNPDAPDPGVDFE